MSRKHGGGDHEEGGHGGDRPWVYFMVDSFFLVTQFFVITFHVKSDEVLLPQKLPPGGTKASSKAVVENKKKMSVHVSHQGNAQYECMQRQVNLAELTDMLRNSTVGNQEVQVRVSYDADVPFQDVMAVFNACAKVKINECGLQPLRID